MGRDLRTLKIVIPVFNDWESFSALLSAIDFAARDLDCAVSVLAIDDGSTEPAPGILQREGAYAALQAAEIVQLSVNVGHQRAIAIGLAVAAHDADADAVLIMDA